MTHRMPVPLVLVLAIPAFLLLPRCHALAEPAGPAGNQPPTIQFLVAPAAGDTVYYLVPFSWQGSDPDGSVPLYRFVIDPAPGDSFWVTTSRTQNVFFFQSAIPEEPLPPTGSIRCLGTHTLAVEALDDLGLPSAPVSRWFTTYTISPDVRIDSPPPDPSGPVLLQASEVTIDWSGIDWDGSFSGSPIKYKYVLFTSQSPILPGIQDPVAFAWADPDSFRKRVAPGFAFWDSTSGGDSSSVQYTNLIGDVDYLFCVVGFDEAGAYSARFGRGVNLMRMRLAPGVSVAGGPEPHALRLEPALPNPASARTALRFVLPRAGPVTLRVFDAGGRRVRELLAGDRPAGAHQAVWNLADGSGRAVTPGLYVARLEVSGAALTRKILVVR